MQFCSLAGAIIILACGFELSRRLNKRYSERLSSAEAYLALLRYIRSQIDCYALPIGDILERADKDLLIRCGWRMEDSPRSLEELLEKSESVDFGANPLLREFCLDFGNNYRDEQLRRCDHYINALSDISDALARELPSKKKLNSTLCISGALAVVILLI